MRRAGATALLLTACWLPCPAQDGAPVSTSRSTTSTTSTKLPIGLADRPVQLRMRHDVTYDPLPGKLHVERIDGDVETATVQVAGGFLALQGHGQWRANRIHDLMTTITVAGVELEPLMRMARLPRAGDLKGVFDGFIYVEQQGENWHAGRIDLRARPGTGLISRALLAELLGFSLDPELLKNFDETLTYHFGLEPMVPLEGLELVGELGEERFDLKLPLRNAAMEVLLEPRIERGVILDAWRTMREQLPLDRLQGIRW